MATPFIFHQLLQLLSWFHMVSILLVGHGECADFTLYLHMHRDAHTCTHTCTVTLLELQKGST